MANYTASARSNYFRVMDRQAFEEWIETIEYNELRVLNGETPDHVGLAVEGDGSSFQMEYEGSDGRERDLLAELAGHLAEGEVAVLMEAGAEKLRYVTGYALAIQKDDDAPEGYRSLQVSLADIYANISITWGVEASAAEY